MLLTAHLLAGAPEEPSGSPPSGKGRGAGTDRGTSEKPVPPPVDSDGVLLEIDDPVYDWGSAYQGEIVEHTFTLSNASRRAVKIEKIKPNCGCTVARGHPEDKVLAPGESIQVTLRVDTAKLERDVKKQAEIFLAGQVAPAGRLLMQGEVQQVFKLEPRLLQIQVVRDAEGARPEPLTVKLQSMVKTPVRLRKMEVKGKVVSLAWKEVEAGRLFSLELRSLVSIDAKPNRHSDELEVTVSLKGKELKLSFPVRVLLKNRIQVRPSRSFWFARKATAELKKPGASPPIRKLTIQSYGGPAHRFRITRVEVEKKLFKARIETVKPGRHYRLLIKLLPPPEDGGKVLRDKIIVHTDDPRVPEITIPGSAQI